MRSSFQAVLWEIWARKRNAALLALALTVFGYVLSAVFPDLGNQQTNGRPSSPAFLMELLSMHLAAAVMILALAICSYTEVNEQSGASGFPHRLFVLPVSTFQLVAVPMVMAIAIIELIYVVWGRSVFKPGEQTVDVAILLATYIVVHQTVLWTLHGLKALRLLVLGFIGIGFIMSPIFGFLYGVSRSSFNGALAGLAATSFLTSWIYVSRQRSGGGSSRELLKSLADRTSNRLSRRDKVFTSPHAAQFWFEWRRCGSVFPTLVGVLLFALIVPLSWYMRNSGEDSLRILFATILMPVVLALPIGKAFSKPDFWSKEITVPGVVATRPITSLDIVAVKLKVAALSAAIAWLLVLIFIATWLPLWANHDSIAMIRGLLWQGFGHSVFPQYAITLLGIFAMMVLTWRFLVGGMWLGLSGNKTVFALSAILYVVVPLFILPAILITVETNPSFPAWMRTHSNQLLYLSVWAAAAAACLKFWLAAIWWRRIPSDRAWRYLQAWFTATALLITLAILLWNVLRFVFPSDPYRLRSLMMLLALLVFPLARTGAAPAALERNRHRN